MVRNSNYAWLAGFLEGEGSFYLHHGKRPKISIGQHPRDIEILEYIKETFQCGTVLGPYKNKTGGVCFWTVTNDEDIKRIIENVFPWLFKRRQEQAMKLLDYIDFKGNKC